jgi:hypothetical protein
MKRNLCTFAESRCNASQLFIRTATTNYTLSKNGVFFYFDLADYKMLSRTEVALAYVTFRFLKCPHLAKFEIGDEPGKNRPDFAASLLKPNLFPCKVFA